jgi:hypothetical protein
MTSPDPAAHGIDKGEHSGTLYQIFIAGSMMFERPNVRDIIRIATESALAVAHCAVLAAYTMRDGRLRRFSGLGDSRVDLLVDAAGGADGVLSSDDGSWRYALFLRGGGSVHGCLVLTAGTEPTTEDQFLLHALARPTAAALATSEIIDRERRNARELRKLGQAQVETNQAMAETIRHLTAHQRVRESIGTTSSAGGGELAIVEALGDLLDRPVVLQDSFGKQRAYAGRGARPAPATALVPDDAFSDEDVPAITWRTSPIRSGGVLLGLLGVADPDRTMDEDDRYALEYAGTNLAVELAHRRSIAEVELRLGRDLADDLVSGADPAGTLVRAETLHYDLGRPQRVLMLSWTATQPSGLDLDIALRNELAAMHADALISRRPDAVLLIAADDHDWSGLHANLASTLGTGRGSIGIGGRYASEDLPRSFLQARRALRMRVESHEPYGVTNHDDLGLFRILDSSDGGAEVESFVQEWIGPLLDYDRNHHSELARTLAVHLDSGGNYDDTAAALIIHRSTLRYRLGRIRALCGHDLSDPDVRLNLHVATRAWAAIRAGRA